MRVLINFADIQLSKQ